MNMLTYKISDFRTNLKKITDFVLQKEEPVVITKPTGNVVVVDEREYNSLQETLYLMSDEANRNFLTQSMAEIDNGETVSYSFDEL